MWESSWIYHLMTVVICRWLWCWWWWPQFTPLATFPSTLSGWVSVSVSTVEYQSQHLWLISWIVSASEAVPVLLPISLIAIPNGLNVVSFVVLLFYQLVLSSTLTLPNCTFGYIHTVFVWWVPFTFSHSYMIFLIEEKEKTSYMKLSFWCFVQACLLAHILEPFDILLNECQG